MRVAQRVINEQLMEPIQPGRIRFRARPIINRLIIWVDIDRFHVPW